MTDALAIPRPLDAGESDRGLSVRHLSVGFRTPRGLLRAVDDVSFDLQGGRTLGVVGESGSGKSVMSRSMLKLLPKTAVVGERSELLFDGRNILQVDTKRDRHFLGVDVAMVFQDPMTSLNPVLKVGAQLAEPLRYHLGLSRGQAARRAVELLEMVGLPDPKRRASQYPHNLSGGMRQRVTIARAIACSPKLLIADEPTTALDVTIQRQILNLLQRIQREQGMTMILITHDLGVVATRTDEIVVMYGGKVMEQAPTRLLFSETRHPYTQALLRSIPRMSDASHTPLATIPGRPAEVIDPKPGCRFAPRCALAQPRCLSETPRLVAGGTPGHRHACFFPLGSDGAASAAAHNVEVGHTAAGLPVSANQFELLHVDVPSAVVASGGGSLRG